VIRRFRRAWGVDYAGGHDKSPGVAPVGRAFLGRVGLSSRWGRGVGVQVNAARMRVQAVAIALAHRQVVSIASRVRRALRVMWAATCRTR